MTSLKFTSIGQFVNELNSVQKLFIEFKTIREKLRTKINKLKDCDIQTLSLLIGNFLQNINNEISPLQENASIETPMLSSECQIKSSTQSCFFHTLSHDLKVDTELFENIERALGIESEEVP